jgi:hypothetical protein
MCEAETMDPNLLKAALFPTVILFGVFMLFSGAFAAEDPGDPRCH